MERDKILSEEKIETDAFTEEAIRPELLSEYIGQKDDTFPIYLLI